MESAVGNSSEASGSVADPSTAVAAPSTTTAHPSGVVPVLQNIVATVNLECRLDLKTIALHARNAEYNPKRFAAVIMRIRDPKTTALIFASGKMVVTGAKSEDQSRLAARKYARIIQKLGFAAKFTDFKIQNIVGSCDIKFPIRLEGLAYAHGPYSSYEPELFPGLIYRMVKPKIVLLIFVSGKIVLTGAKVRDEIYQAFENIYPLNHKDLVHDISYDFYGTRMATCSSDQRLKVFDQKFSDQEDTNDPAWVMSDEWKAHDASVLKVKWAHPEFGQVLASSSFDRTVRIWEENDFEPKCSAKRWTEKARLVDSRGSVQDIEFAPRHLGLRLASASTDGSVRIYEALDVMNVSHWTLMEEFQISVTAREVDGQFCLSWCPNRFLPPMLIVGCGKEFTARLYQYDEQTRQWNVLVQSLGSHANFVYDVSWAPNMGRSYELIATASKDGRVRIFKISNLASVGKMEDPLFRSLANKKTPSINASGSDGPSVMLVADFPDHEAEVWRVSWNVTGSILSSSGDDGQVRLWKSDAFNIWKSLTSIPYSSSSTLQK